MHYNQSWAAKGQHAGRHPHLHMRSMQRAAVNIYKTDNSFELLLFAPGRIREHFKLDVQGTDLIISYTPPADFPRQDWIKREYSRGGFERTFTLDETIDTKAISAKYEDGVLHISLPVTPGKESTKHEIKVS